MVVVVLIDEGVTGFMHVATVAWSDPLQLY